MPANKPIPQNYLPGKNKDFFLAVYQVVQLIPKGRVTSYGAIARFLGAARSARMVGWAMNSSHTHDPSLPAHRVVNRNGLLTGKAHFGDPLRMQQLLEAEGISVKNDRIVDFNKHFWDPSEHIDTGSIPYEKLT